MAADYFNIRSVFSILLIYYLFISISVYLSFHYCISACSSSTLYFLHLHFQIYYSINCISVLPFCISQSTFSIILFHSLYIMQFLHFLFSPCMYIFNYNIPSIVLYQYLHFVLLHVHFNHTIPSIAYQFLHFVIFHVHFELYYSIIVYQRPLLRRVLITKGLRHEVLEDFRKAE